MHLAQPGHRAARDDSLDVRAAAELLRSEREGHKPRSLHSSETRAWIRAARDLAYSDAPMRAEVEARILAGQTDDEIARRCALCPEVARSFAALFFSVRDRLGARDWIVAHAIGASPLSGYSDTSSVLRAVGYFGGVQALDLMIAATGWGTEVKSSSAARSVSPDGSLLDRARLLAAALLLPADVGLKAHASLYALVIRIEGVRMPTTVAEAVAQQTVGVLDDDLENAGERVALEAIEPLVA